jgi:hypothetical protein
MRVPKVFDEMIEVFIKDLGKEHAGAEQPGSCLERSPGAPPHDYPGPMQDTGSLTAAQNK